ncbi:carboxypeptidase-like regulatory domain-containing protein [Sphingobacterium sp. ML3W]|uniref:energy transducer TonB family protein n=1 Tax=Sphingobacterium sp. ML3W TaxID=1538644 RepID=UPI00249C800B|nr:carboxypeptidase-like regulatory domain-containing protein [Sphingobacterium sp. ML3W]WFA79144.1 carboxypeptidase-like regulatory domain-containing protein [Sphingobacterium sp. ML3W]
MSDSNYDIAYLKKYVNGQLSPKEMYAIEREAQRDPMLADILMGIEMDQNRTVPSELNARIAQRIEHKKEAKIKVFDWKRLAIAATVVAVLSAGILYFQQQKSPSEAKRTADAAMPADVPSSKSIPQHDTAASSTIDPSIKEQDSPRLADNSKSSNLGQYNEETVPAHQEPSTRIAPIEKMNNGIHRDRAIADSKMLDSVEVFGYTPQAKKSITGSSVVIRGQQVNQSNALAGRIAGVNVTPQTFGSPLQVTVRDKETGLPISGVTIMQPNSKLATNTDVQGKATIQPSTVDSLVDIMAVGYNTVALNMRRNKNLNIKLQPSSATLDEVVVTTMSSRKTKSAEPVWGWKSFNNYVKKKTANSRYEGAVRLNFYIDKDGFPSNINILQSANDYLDNKAKEILLSGPKWKGEDNRYVTLTFDFTY